MTDLGESKAVPERVWIAAYTSGPNSGVLSRGLYFRSIHNSREEADRYISHQTNPVGFTVTEYVGEATIREQAQTIERLTKICCGALCLQCAKGSPVIVNSAGYYSHQEEGNHCNASRIHKAIAAADLEPKP